MPLIKGAVSLKRNRYAVFVRHNIAFTGNSGRHIFFRRALLLIINCVISAVLTEIIVLKIRKKPLVINDFSAIVTGLLLALILPPTTAWYAAWLGSIFSIFIGKHLFGGLGANIFNPALLGRAFLMAAYPTMRQLLLNHFRLTL